MIGGYWASIFNMLSQVLETAIVPSPRIALLGLLEDMGVVGEIVPWLG